MRRLTVAWAIVWRMLAYGVGLGVAGGAICGPISMLILYTAELLSGRYNLSDFPYSSAGVYCFVAVIAGAVLGGLLGFLSGMVSGVTLALGLLLSGGDFFAPKLYRNLLVAFSAAGSSAVAVIPLSKSILGNTWFYNGESVVLPLLAMAVLPAIIAAIATWWAGMRVVTWWETAQL